MEQVRDPDPRPLDPHHPVICVDAVSRSLQACAGPPVPARPGQVARRDCTYRRAGTRHLFRLTAPCAGGRPVKVTARRTKRDCAAVLPERVEVHCPAAARITRVCDHLHTHTPGALYERFPAPVAHRRARRLEWVYTPQPASGLHSAEIEISVLTRQARARRIPDEAARGRQIAAWAQQRHAGGAPVHGRFTSDDARLQLRHLYPQT